MRTLGVILMICGFIGLVWAFSLDTLVSTGYGSVNNIGLMNDKQNYIMVSIGAIVLGFLMMALDSNRSAPSGIDKHSIASQPARFKVEYPDLTSADLDELGVYEKNGYYCFQNGKTKSLDTAVQWAKAARAMES